MCSGSIPIIVSGILASLLCPASREIRKHRVFRHLIASKVMIVLICIYSAAPDCKISTRHASGDPIVYVGMDAEDERRKGVGDYRVIYRTSLSAVESQSSPQSGCSQQPFSPVRLFHVCCYNQRTANLRRPGPPPAMKQYVEPRREIAGVEPG